MYEVLEDIVFDENVRRVPFEVYFDEDTHEIVCNCQLLSFRGIVCKHQIVVMLHNQVYKILRKYILRRWSKSVKGIHSKVRISYDKSANIEGLNFDKMCNAFHEVANIAAPFFPKVDQVMMRVRELKAELMEDQILCEGSNTFAFVDSTSKKNMWEFQRRAPTLWI